MIERVSKEQAAEIRRTVQKGGIYEKFIVTRTDGRSAPGEKHDGCRYFVLDLNHDPHAIPALKAYAASCRDDYPSLASDLHLLSIDMELAFAGKDTGERSVLRREWPRVDSEARAAPEGAVPDVDVAECPECGFVGEVRIVRGDYALPEGAVPVRVWRERANITRLSATHDVLQTIPEGTYNDGVNGWLVIPRTEEGE